MLKNLSTRRVFLQKGLTLLAAGATVPAFINQTVMALADPLDVKRTQQASGKDGKILVIVQLSGGNDGLNTVVPYGDDAYHRARPGIKEDPNTLLKINNYIGLQQNLTCLKEMYDQGRCCIVQGVGYPNPNRSHFRSMDIWQSGIPEKEIVTSGWVGRYFDNTCKGEDPHVGVTIGGNAPIAMQGERVKPLNFDRPESYRYNGPDKEHYMELNQKKKAVVTEPEKKIIKPEKKKIEVSSASELDFLHRTAMDAQVSSDDILRMTRNFQPEGQYPGGEFGNGLRTIAAMIGGKLPTRVYYVSLGGFDTHAGQRGRHDQLMRQLNEGLTAFWKDMKKQENDDRVMLVTFSEFGRRVEQNASAGTDHGAASQMFIMGPKLKGGLFGKHPSLTDLDQGDLKYNTDFRSVYATILQNWMDTPSKPILGQQFGLLPILKA